jgi:hypothetical protein
MLTLVETATGVAEDSRSELGAILEDAIALVGDTVSLKRGRYTVDTAKQLDLLIGTESTTGVLRVKGKGRATEVAFRATTPLILQVPDLAGYPTTKLISTACLGMMFTSQLGISREVLFEDITFVGHTGIAAVAGHYDLISACGASVSFKNCTFLNEESALYDASSGVLSPYKGLSKRNFLSLTLVRIGMDSWLEPNPDLAVATDGGRVEGCAFYGEPLSQTSGASPRLIAVRVRRHSNFVWGSHNTFGQQHPPVIRSSDIVATGQPANGNQFQISPFDPFTKSSGSLIFTFVSGTPATLQEIKIGASAGESYVNAAQVVNQNRVDAGGVLFAEAFTPSQYLPGGTDGVDAAIRIRELKLRSDLPTAIPLFQASFDTSDAFVAIAIANATLRAIEDGIVKKGHWMWGVIMEDAWAGLIAPCSIGSETFTNEPLYMVATTTDALFLPDLWSERGHKSIQAWTGEGNTLRGGMMIRDSGFSYIEGPRYGSIIVTGKGVVTIERGIHRAWTITFSGGGNVADADRIRVLDGNGGDKTFEFDNNSTVTGGNVSVTMGTGLNSSLEALRKKIVSQVDAHALTCFVSKVEEPVAGTFVLAVSFFTLTEYASASSLSEVADVGSKIALADASVPYKPRYIDLVLGNHNTGISTSRSVPSLWCEYMNSKLTVSGSINAYRQPFQQGSEGDPAKTSQAVRSLAIVGVPANGQTVTIDSIASGGPGAATVFEFTTGAPAGSNTKIDTTGLTTAVQAGNAFIAAVNAKSLASTLAFAASGDGIDLGGFVLVYVYDGQIGVNASGVGPGTGSAGSSVGTGALLNVSNGGQLVIGSDTTPGSANAALQGEQYPIVLKNVTEADISGLSASAFSDIRMPMQLVYATTTVPSRIVLSGNRVFGALGQGRFAAETLLLAGSGISIANDVVTMGDNYVNGRKV